MCYWKDGSVLPPYSAAATRAAGLLVPGLDSLASDDLSEVVVASASFCSPFPIILFFSIVSNKEMQ